MLSRLKCVLSDENFEHCREDMLADVIRTKVAGGRHVPEEVIRKKTDHFRFLFAIRDYNRLQKAADRDILAYLMAKLYRKIQHPRADEFVIEGIRRNPSLFAEFKRNGAFAIAGKDWRTAQGYFTDALEIRKNDASVLAMRAAAYWESGEAGSARKDICEALQLQPADPVVKAMVRIYFGDVSSACSTR